MNPSGQLLMQRVIEDSSLPLAIRLQAIREPSFRPGLSFLLRLIRDPITPTILRAAAVIRYNQLQALKETVHHARRNERSRAAEEVVIDTAAE